ncbi:RING-H2 finger protein ATL40-like [Neltuma alba]|uniref:RING-H2 finger protein ATL40-like n=1 Tax=Neltuma alba TaxID=207710 RepID=UPI0010A56BBB|nr:RING-H2 finger protein ATL40-like [Prosopis alba]
MNNPQDGSIPFELPAALPRRPVNSDHNSLNSSILYIAIISLSIVLVLVFALHLYARYVLRRQARRRAAIHHLSLAVARFSSGDPPNNTGLDPTVIASLPTFVFKRRNENDDRRRGDSSSVMECSVCLSNLEGGEEARLLPNCQHVFHVACIDRWLESHSTCPICRTMARPVIEPRPREGPVGARQVQPAVHDAPTAPPVVEPTAEGTSDGGGAKSSGSVSRLSSFRRMLSRERSSRRIQPPSSSSIGDDSLVRDLERQ